MHASFTRALPQHVFCDEAPWRQDATAIDDPIQYQYPDRGSTRCCVAKLFPKRRIDEMASTGSGSKNRA